MQALLDAVPMLERELLGWPIIGVLACRAPRARLGRFLARDDVRVWCREDLERTASAEQPEAIRDLLWRPLGMSVEDEPNYFLGYLPPLWR